MPNSNIGDINVSLMSAEMPKCWSVHQDYALSIDGQGFSLKLRQRCGPVH
ncbi:MAG: hypothetical protein ACLSVD_02045 [Eggerthellaceae bacterium]